MIEVIEVPDGAGTEMVRRVPAAGSGEFTLGAQVIVRESQVAVFFRDGKSYDVFGPGRHTLSTLNLPLIGARLTGRVFGQSPFKAEVYFVNRNVFTAIKWGTRDPIAYRDRELAMVRLRAHGEMAVRVSDPVLFVNKVVGARGIYTAKDVEGFLKSLVLSSLAQTIGGVLDTILDLPPHYDEIATATKARVHAEFAACGTELAGFVIESITPPAEVQSRIDERTSIGAIGDLDTYRRYKGAVALADAASTPHAAGGVLDAGAGLAMGMYMMRETRDALAETPARPAETGAAGACGSCRQAVPPGSRFCPHCGASLGPVPCENCHQPLTAGARFCASCGHPITST
jgi:membrane protease subunit (stomatin/prohibitin family)